LSIQEERVLQLLFLLNRPKLPKSKHSGLQTGH
jgi:hypothetical protein